MGQIPPLTLIKKMEAAIGRATATSRPVEKKESRYWPIVIGALIGMIPSMFLSTTQATYQRRQSFFDHRLTLLTELSTTVYVDGNNILSNLSDFELDVVRSPDVLTVEQDAALTRKLLDLNRAIHAWSGKISIQINMMNGLFDLPKVLVPIIPKSGEFGLENGPRQFGGRNWKIAALGTIKSMRTNTISTISHLQGALVTVSKTLEY